MKRYLPYILCTILLVYLIIVLTFVDRKVGEARCKGINVYIDHNENAFISALDVCDEIKHRYGNIVNAKVETINTDSLEQMLTKSSMIKSAQVYYSLDGNFHINIIQRKPVLRVVSGRDGYYVDEDGKKMPLSGKYTSKVTPITGKVSVTFAENELFEFVNYISNNSFWNAYVEQIVVDSQQDVLLIPKVGDFHIRMGRLDDFKQKLSDLQLFLNDGINRKGWRAYKEINLKYENQIVCVKK
ncbi:MAG: cell division protein FtsQ/DivIB [Marinifilaceae bacterium]